MGRYLAISSQVAHGHVGLSAIVPALHALGHEVIALPTVLLSNHPGHTKVAGQRVDPTVLGQILDALAANGRLEGIDAVLTGYLPSSEHVGVAAHAVRLAKPACYFCDPVLGDDPKGLYIADDAAQAIKSVLLPLATMISPNRFELAWLSGLDVSTAETAVHAARSLDRDRVFATSIPAAEHSALLTMRIDRSAVVVCRVGRRLQAPHGTGDLLSALLVAGVPLGQAVASVDAAIGGSSGQDELRLIASRADWLHATAIAEEPFCL